MYYFLVQNLIGKCDASIQGATYTCALAYTIPFK